MENKFDIILTFGKYKGKRISEVPKTYISWLVNNVSNNYIKDQINKYHNECFNINFKKAKKLIDEGEIVYGVDIHGVGFEFRAKGISLEDIMGNRFFLNDEYITKDQYKLVYDYLYPIYEKQGKQRKDRGLY